MNDATAQVAVFVTVIEWLFKGPQTGKARQPMICIMGWRFIPRRTRMRY